MMGNYKYNCNIDNDVQILFVGLHDIRKTQNL